MRYQLRHYPRLDISTRTVYLCQHFNIQYRCFRAELTLHRCGWHDNYLPQLALYYPLSARSSNYGEPSHNAAGYRRP